MRRTIIAFHQDGQGDWVARLACGHDQHVRHKPPFIERPWVVSEAGRGQMLGEALECKLCDLDEAQPGTRESPSHDGG